MDKEREEPSVHSPVRQFLLFQDTASPKKQILMLDGIRKNYEGFRTVKSCGLTKKYDIVKISEENDKGKAIKWQR